MLHIGDQPDVVELGVVKLLHQALSFREVTSSGLRSRSGVAPVESLVDAQDWTSGTSCCFVPILRTCVGRSPRKACATLGCTARRWWSPADEILILACFHNAEHKPSGWTEPPRAGHFESL